LALLAACAEPQEQDEPVAGQAATAGGTDEAFELKPGSERITFRASPSQALRAQAKADLTEDHGSIQQVETLAKQRAAFNATNTWSMARLSNLAYLNEAELKVELAKIGLKTDAAHFQFFENTCTDAQAFYITNADNATTPADVANSFSNAASTFAVLAFRGTEPTKMKDLGSDALAIQVDANSKNPMGRVHKGFKDALDSLWTPVSRGGCTVPAVGIKDYLAARHSYDGKPLSPIRKGAELYFTGHSLGAAMATFALSRTVTDRCNDVGNGSREGDCFLRTIPVSALITFGSPRVGNNGWSTALSESIDGITPVYRVVHGLDIVTDVPSLANGKFIHLGYENDSLFKVQLTRTSATAEAIKFVLGRFGERGNGGFTSRAADHSMTEYEPALRLIAKGASAH
jgi:hypothetical protein